MDALEALKKTRWSNPTSFFYSPGAMGGEDRLHPSAQGPLHTPAAGIQKKRRHAHAAACPIEAGKMPDGPGILVASVVMITCVPRRTPLRAKGRNGDWPAPAACSRTSPEGGETAPRRYAA